MKRICRIEWAKTAPYSFVKVMVILLVALYLLVIFSTSRINFAVPGFTWRNIYKFPDNWDSFAWVASWFNIFLAIIVITVSGNEFQHRTFRQQVMSGLGRNEWLAGKAMLIVFLALIGVVMVFVTSLIFGFIFTWDITFSMVFKGSQVLFVYFIQAVGYMILGLLFASVFRTNALSIMMFILYFVLIEPITRILCPREMRVWFPVKIISHLTPAPEIMQVASNGGSDNARMTFEGLGLASKQLSQSVNVLVALVYIALFSFLIWTITRKRDL